MMEFDLWILLRSYLISLGVGLLVWPMVRMIFEKLPDRGWSLVRVLSTFLVALIVWEIGYLGLPVNTMMGIYGALAVLGVLNGWVIFKKGLQNFSMSAATFKLIIFEEYLFLICLVGMGLVRAYAPEIDSLEKFMDFGFVKQYLVSPTLPAMDMWQAGLSINYYSFGHFWSSVIIRILGVTPGVGYNISLAMIFAMAFSLVFSIVNFLVSRKGTKSAVAGGLIAAVMTLLAGNSHVIWYMLKNRGLSDYWYAEATRFIHNTIHEFPSYSFTVSDLHGHVLGLPIVLAFILVFVLWLSERKIIQEILLGIFMGIMMMTNTWDVAVYGLLMVVAGGQIVISKPKEIIKLMRTAGIILLVMILVSLPWFVSFQSISNGVRLVTERTPLWQLAALWTGGLLVSLMAVVLEGKGEKKLAIRTLAITALLLLIIPELIYAKDIYPNHPRANTMFKLTYQAFIMMGILAGVAWGKIFDFQKKIWLPLRISLGVLIMVIVVGCMIFPSKSFTTFYANFANYKGLDGTKWIATKLPEYAGAIDFLDKNRDGKNLVEAVGESYTMQNAVSVFSGVPSVQGWRVHEWLWRGSFEPVAKRENDVREIYQGEDIEKTKEIIKKYNVGWILVGEDEEIAYKVNETKLWQMGEMVWKKGETYLIKVN